MSIPNEEQRQLAIELRKLGVKVIVGSHPHVKQGHEWINGTLVHYSLGNFVFHPHYTYMGVSNQIKQNKQCSICLLIVRFYGFESKYSVFQFRVLLLYAFKVFKICFFEISIN